MTETVYWHPEAEKDVEQLSEKKQDVIGNRVDEFSREGTSYKYFGRVTVEEHDFDKFKIKVKEQQPLKINQRIVLDRYHRSWVILGVCHREDVYKSEFVEQLMEREY